MSKDTNYFCSQKSVSLKMTRAVYNQIIETIGSTTPECGGVLGADENGTLTAYYYDATGLGDSSSYSPDVAAINKILTHQWMPQGIYMVGIVHSHEKSRVPSCGDIAYAVRILAALDTVSYFYLPILIIDKGIPTMYGYVLRNMGNKQIICEETTMEIVE